MTTQEMIPEHAKNFHLTPGKKLRIRMQLSKLDRIFFYSISLLAYLIFCSILIFFSLEVLQLPTEISYIFPSAITFLLWITVNRIGPTMTIFLDRLQYTVTLFPFRFTRPRMPQFTIDVRESRAGWSASLNADDSRISISPIFQDASDAQNVFRDFVAALDPSSETLRNDERTVALLSDRETLHRSDGELTSTVNVFSQATAILVHGTRGSQSDWIDESKSKLIRGVQRYLNRINALDKVKFDKFRWSGENRENDRETAACKLTKKINDTLRGTEQCVS